jgi:hypothetical protein
MLNSRNLRAAAIPILVISLIAVVLFTTADRKDSKTNTISKLKDQIAKGDIESVEVDAASSNIKV